MGQNIERFAEHVRTRAVNPPSLLFKYTSLQTARLVIQTERVRFSSPLQFNDPFDGQWDTLWQVGTPEFNEAIAKRIVTNDFDLARVRDGDVRAEFEKLRRGYASCDTDAERHAYLQRVANSLDRGIVAQTREPNLLSRLRVLCLAAVPDSIQMWSYYGDHHRGALLAFHTETLESFWEIPAEQVQYAEALPEVIDPADHFDYYMDAGDKPEPDHHRIGKAWTLTKASGWSHENEWRFASLAKHGDEREYEDIQFPIKACVAIAAGCSADMEAFNGVAAELLTKCPEAKIWHLARHARCFGLVAQPYKPEDSHNGT